jgi:glutathione S-transferase
MTRPAHDRPRVELTVDIRASRERVFDAWVSSTALARFLCAGNTHVQSIDVDARVGGSFRVVMANDAGAYEHRGTYLTIDRPTRLRFTWQSHATDHEATTVTVTFEEIPDGTRVRLIHEGLPSETAATRHGTGWRSILDKSAHLVDLD